VPQAWRRLVGGPRRRPADGKRGGGPTSTEVEVSAEAKGGVMEADGGAQRRPRVLLG